ncbi:DUF6443 domain-containing protein [Flavobacterium sp. PLA-1-15]|uniref:DUF6443 domain-containing protein n=1 Tax=Flavobacterium sp. PLA-1-15 TaxID=3380533 RepID=UPI003B773EAA
MRYLFSIVAVCLSSLVHSQSTDQNYYGTSEPKMPVTVADYEAGIYDPSTYVLRSFEYVDGFNRVLQSVSVKANPNQKDLVSFSEYDDFGRQSKQYLPFFSDQTLPLYLTDAKNIQKAYYQTKFNDLTPFTEVRLDNSPLNRVVEKSNVGDVWKMLPTSDADKTEKYSYGLNQANEIKIYTVDANGLINNSSYYPIRKLFKSIVKNENWVTADGNLNSVEVYTDVDGKKIAEVSYGQQGTAVEKLITQYVYDERGLLRYVLPPRAMNHDFQSFSVATGRLSWNFTRFISSENPSGGGSVSAGITNGVLSVTFSGGFNSSVLKTGPIVYLDERIPNVSLGNLSCTSCSGNYRLYVENGFLCIAINTYPISTTGFSGTYTATVGDITFLSNQQLLDKYAFQYKYDDYNRKIEQKTPGKGWEYNVFDQLDRPILTQDQNLKANNYWLYTKYDAFGRVVYTGKHRSTFSRAELQVAADAYIAANTSNQSNVEERVSSQVMIGYSTGLNYSNNAFPTTELDVLTVNYYDDYNFEDIGFYGVLPETPQQYGGEIISTNTRGLLTASYAASSHFNGNYLYYNEKARVVCATDIIQSLRTDVQHQYDFRGNVLKTLTTHTERGRPNRITTIEERFEYDHAERLLGEYQKINSQPEHAIVRYVYDDVGTMVEKKVGGIATATTPLQTVKYAYNIRGWLTKLNNPTLMGTSLFAYEIKYNNPTALSTPLYTGNISQVQWKTAIPASGLKTYNYSYDKLNRLTEANFRNSNNSTHTKSFLERLAYDKNGNITSLYRTGNVIADPLMEWLDVLSYKYDGNQLVGMTETGHDYEGYKSYLTGSVGNIYEYDANGNLIRDRNKGIDIITYNHLDLIEEIHFTDGRNIVFTYDATGRKISKSVYDGVNSSSTMYMGRFQYGENGMQHFSTSEGYAAKVGTEFKYVYIYSDHLGNNRLSYSDADNNGYISTSEIQSINDYYALGGMHSGSITNSLATNYLYKFQGKEYNAENSLNMYDFGSRMYDPAVGRWFSTDPQNQFASPYVAMGNNPVFHVDPDGEWVHIVVGAVVGGVINVATNWDNIGDFGDGLAYFGTGAVSGAYIAGTGDVVGGSMMLGAGNNIYGQYKAGGYSFDNFNPGEALQATAISGVTSYVGGALGAKLTGPISNLYSKVPNELAKQYLTQVTTSSATGFTLGTGASLMQGNSFEQSLNVGLDAARVSVVTTSISFSGDYLKGAYKPKTEQQKVKQNAEQEEFFALESKNKGLSIAPQEAQKGTDLVPSYPTTAEVKGSKSLEYLMPGQTVDRYGPIDGKWLSFPGVPYSARSIPPGLTPKTEFTVVKPFQVEQSTSTHGFLKGQYGGGIQFRTPVPIEVLLKRGIIIIKK